MKTKITKPTKKSTRRKARSNRGTSCGETGIPDVLTRYIEAANRHDVATATGYFAPDATVHDESREHTGTQAIRAWIEETSRKYRPTFTVMGARVSSDEITLSVAVSGQFPGSPVALDYAIRLREGKISTLTIQ